ncbi:MAG: hypothetical protein A2284_18275 [Deltaproteobacteria bacterium RIFOXYA12_FULL_61_11]|nr:MAG: hypothetical protein A2284_18275 [Deltaproteobacteria bacterium RIFOXYA12_FULL_61_11]
MVRTILLSLIALLTLPTYAALLTCKVLPGPYIGYLEPGMLETSVSVILDPAGRTAKATISLVPSDGQDIMLLREVQTMILEEARPGRVYAKASEMEEDEVILAELDLEAKGVEARGKTLFGTLYDGGVEFSLECR